MSPLGTACRRPTPAKASKERCNESRSAKETLASDYGRVHGFENDDRLGQILSLDYRPPVSAHDQFGTRTAQETEAAVSGGCFQVWKLLAALANFPKPFKRIGLSRPLHGLDKLIGGTST